MNATISANVLVRNELKYIDSFVGNMLEAGIDEIVFLDGGSFDGSYERLQYWESQYSHIHVLLWKQAEKSSYKKGFNEVARRNLLIEASSSSYILYIDVDERISSDFKKECLNINEAFDIMAISRYHFWGRGIRINLLDDKVWYPDYCYRLFKRSNYIHFASKDANGLHNYLEYKGRRIYGGFNKSALSHLLIIAMNRVISLLGGPKIYINKTSNMYHFHYFDLSDKKENDLRSGEFKFKIEYFNSASQGYRYTLGDEVVPCIPISILGKTAESILQNFISGSADRTIINSK